MKEIKGKKSMLSDKDWRLYFSIRKRTGESDVDKIIELSKGVLNRDKVIEMLRLENIIEREG